MFVFLTILIQFIKNLMFVESYWKQVRKNEDDFNKMIMLAKY
jgi:hypothetical protein